MDLDKTSLRQDFKARLATIPVAQAREGSRRIAERLLVLPEMASARRIFTCLSFGHEVDTWELIERLRADGREIFVPRAAPRTREIHVHPYPCELKTLSFGLRQPVASAPALPAELVDETLDIALVLGLAFDREGYRLGYGGGYFDRFLRAPVSGGRGRLCGADGGCATARSARRTDGRRRDGRGDVLIYFFFGFIASICALTCSRGKFTKWENSCPFLSHSPPSIVTHSPLR